MDLHQISGKVMTTTGGKLVVEVTEKVATALHAAAGCMTRGYEVEVGGERFEMLDRGKRFDRGGSCWRYLYVRRIGTDPIDAAIGRVNAEGTITA